MNADHFKYRAKLARAKSGVCHEAIALTDTAATLVIPAKAGISSRGGRLPGEEIPAFAGMTTSRRGFTLVELLVALAIFMTIMAIVALFFTAAIRTSKQGVQNQEAFELARGAMRLFERDLSRAFTNRDHGDVYSFYGTPIGFTYVGMVNIEGTDAYNLARVTYVIYHNPIIPGALDQLAAAVDAYETVDGAIVPVYSLLRIVEPGIDNLDAFRVPWTSLADLDSGTPQTLEDIAIQIRDSALCPDAACEEVAMQTARRDIWIRMLSGGDEFVESAWEHPDMFLDDDPRDYVVADNIRYLYRDIEQCAPTREALEDLLETLNLPAIDFDDEIYDVDQNTVCMRAVSDVYSVAPSEIPLYDDSWSSIIATQEAARPYFTYWDIGVLVNNTETLSDDKVTPIAYQFWNDIRNLAEDGLDNDGDGLFDAADPTETYGTNVGSPLDSRLPLAVTVDFTLFFRSPYLGAPDFNQRFTQRIDLPTGHRRLFKTTAPVP